MNIIKKIDEKSGLTMLIIEKEKKRVFRPCDVLYNECIIPKYLLKYYPNLLD